MKRKLVPMLGLAIVFGAISIFVADALVKSNTSPVQSAPVAASAAPRVELKKIVIAKQPLRYGMELTPEVLVETDWPANALPEGAFFSITELAASGRVVLSSIEPNEPVLATKLSGLNGRATLSNRLEPGKRAVTIRVDDISGVAGFVTPGDRVDVVLTRQQGASSNAGSEAAGQGGQPGEYASEVILEDIKVLTADQRADEQSSTPEVAKAVTIEVSTEQAQKVALAQQVGTLYLLLRAAGDQENTIAAKMTVSDLSGRKNTVPVSAKADSSSWGGLFKAGDGPKFRTMTVTRGHSAESYSVMEEKQADQGNR